MKTLFTFFLSFCLINSSKAQQKQLPKYEFSEVTVVESVVPGGLGRSRMVTSDKNGAMEEIKLENFFSMVGINFENIRNNDKVISDKITKLTNINSCCQHYN